MVLEIFLASHHSLMICREKYNGFFFFFCLFAFSRAAPAAYGGSQARGLIGVVAAGLRHSSWQLRILNPLSKARDRTRNLMVPSWICQPLNHDRNS